MEASRQTGIIRKFDSVRGIGLVFITHSQQYFLHISKFNSVREPIPGEKVSFVAGEITRAGSLPEALDITPENHDTPDTVPVLHVLAVSR